MNPIKFDKLSYDNSLHGIIGDVFISSSYDWCAINDVVDYYPDFVGDFFIFSVCHDFQCFLKMVEGDLLC